MKLNLGCGKQPVEGWTNLDKCELRGVDVVFDLEKCGEERIALNTPWDTSEPLPYEPVRLPFEDDSVEEFQAVHVFEHLRNLLPVLEELYRVAAPEAILTVRVPHGASDVAWENPTHVRPWFPSSFAPFEQPYWWREDSDPSRPYRADWKPVLIQVLVDKALYQGVDVEVIRRDLFQKRNTALELIGTVQAVKPARLPLKELQEGPRSELVLTERPQ